MAALEVEETIRRLSSHKGVEGIVISSYEGVALKSTLPKDLTTKYAGLMSQLVVKARGVVRTIDAEVSLPFIISLVRLADTLLNLKRGLFLHATFLFHAFAFAERPSFFAGQN
jgi:predicted regulator of Ras-like GTPase activity (Roadblock/LC7/MglB family)